MNHVVMYRVRPDQADHNAELIHAVYEELELTQPDALRYATLRLDDGVTFIHIAVEPDHGPNPLFELEAFQRFVEGIKDRCDDPPTTREAYEVGSFRFFASEDRNGQTET